MLIFHNESQRVLFDLEGLELWAGCSHGTGDQLALLLTCTNSTGRGGGPVHSAIDCIFSSFDPILMVQSAAQEFGGLEAENKVVVMGRMLKYADK